MTVPLGRPAPRRTRHRSRPLGRFALPFGLILTLAPLAAQSDGDLDLRYGDSGVARHNVQADHSLAGLACAPNATCYTAVRNFAGDFRIREIDRFGEFINEANVAFNVGGSNIDTPQHLAVGADGKPVVTGFAEDGEERLIAVARLTHVAGFPPFVLDTGFSGDGKATHNSTGAAESYGVAVGPSGEIVVVGCYSTDGPAGDDFMILRFLPDGTPDPGFSGNGSLTIDFDHGTAGDNDCATAVAVRPDGRIVVAGYAQFGALDYDFAVAGLLADGTLDPSFSTDGLHTVFFDQGTTDADQVAGVAVDRFGRVVLAGYAETDAGYKPALARLTSAGVLDASFSGDGKFLGSEGAFAIAMGVATLPSPSERIVYMTFGGTLAALTESGAPDNTFGAGGIVPCGDPDADSTLSRRKLAVLGGMPIVAGESVVGGTNMYFVTRYWMDQIFGDDFEAGNLNAWAGW
jgi:uncharacterized delta-60 repeat protein